jgi:hypothetical protein
VSLPNWFPLSLSPISHKKSNQSKKNSISKETKNVFVEAARNTRNAIGIPVDFFCLSNKIICKEISMTKKEKQNVI